VIDYFCGKKVMAKVQATDTVYPLDALKRLYHQEGSGRIKERLLAIIHLYEGRSPEQISKLLQRSANSIRTWRKRWNAQGYQGLKLELTGGPKAQLSAEQWQQVAVYVQDKGLSIEEVRQYIEQHYDISYGYHMVWRELRQKRGLTYGKPFMVNDKMPPDAEGQLKKK
jgi:transposase